MYNEKLTGRTRYRTERRLFKSDLLVLQVEVSWPSAPPIATAVTNA